MYKCYFCGNVFDIAEDLESHVAGGEFMCGACYDFTHGHDDDIDDDDDEFDGDLGWE